MGKNSKWPQISHLFDFKPQAFLSLQLAVIQLYVWKRGKLQNVQHFVLLMGIEIWSCHSFVHRNGEIVYRQIYRACDEHMYCSWEHPL